MRKEILIGTRNSPLAIAQAEIIRQSIIKKYELRVELVLFKTNGDKNLRAFSELKGVKGIFTHELEQALIKREIDLAVHSLKDMATNQNPELKIRAYSRREDPRDGLIIKSGLTELPDEKIILGSSSLRRKMQLERIYPKAEIRNIRGNINTRIKKLDNENYSGIVLAVAGLKRLNIQNKIARYFSIDEIMPAPGQGILACQGRSDENYYYLDSVNDEISEYCAIAEGNFSECLGAGCNVPVGAYAFIDKKILTLSGLFIDEKSGIFYRESLSGDFYNAKDIGKNLAEMVIKECNL